jgi:peptide/nickel transport system substrate-binding protein
VGFGALVFGVLPAWDGVGLAAEAPPAINVPGVEPFQPPPLAEIEAKAGWVDQPVVDPIKLLREKQAGETPPASVSEALSLQNDSDEANRKILGALGRLPASDAEVNWDGMITRHQMFDVKSTNPLMASSTEEFDMSTLMGINLFSFDWTLKPFAESAFVKSWQTSADRMVDKIVMRDDLTWSDGKPVTAYDVQFSYETIMNPKIQIPAMRSGPDKLRAVVAYDERTVLYFHKEALASNIWNVNFALIPKHVYEKTIPEDYTLANSPEHVRLQDSPVTGGPYVLSRRARNQELVFERRESYYMHGGKQVRDKPYFKTVRFSLIQEPNTALLALKKGDVDEMLLQRELWQTQTTTNYLY